MIALMTFAAFVCVVQLAVVGSWARSLRVTTLLQVLGVGFLACGPVAVAVEWALTRAVAALGPWSLTNVVAFASWTSDPLVEEVVKVAPLALLAWLWPRVQRQLGWVDHLLVGAALGAGFALFEAALRYSRLGLLALPTDGGYAVAGGLFGVVVVPSLWTSLTTWQPPPAAVQQWVGSGADTVQHLVWTALAGLGVALLSRRTDRWRWAGLVPLLVVWLDHANGNAVAAAVPFAATWTSAAITWVGYRLAGLVLLALLALTVVDRRRLAAARRTRGDVLLSGEPASGLDPRRMLQLALVAPPWSTWTTWSLVLLRRAALTAWANGVAAPALADRVPELVGRLAHAQDPVAWRAGAARLVRRVEPRSLVSWRTVVWLISLVPAVAYLVVGGFPATRDLQRAMSGAVGTWLLAIGLVAGAGLVGLSLPALVRRLRSSPEPAVHEVRLRPVARLLVAGPTLLLSALTLAMLALGRRSTDSLVVNYHALEALSSTELVVGLALLALSFLFFPPAAAFLVVADTGALVLTASGATLFAGSTIGLSLAAHALLSEATGGWSGGDNEIGDGGADFDYEPRDPFTGRWFDPEVGPADTPPRVTGYVNHALDRLELRGFTRQEAEDLVSSPPSPPRWQPGPGTWLYEARNGLKVAVNLAGQIVSVMD